MVIDGPVPALPDFPPPGISIPEPPYDESKPHPLSVERVSLSRVQQAVQERARDWGVPGTFHVNSLWQITDELQIASGFYDGVLSAGVVTVPSKGKAQFHDLPKVGGGGPATVVGVKQDRVLIRAAMSYVVYNYLTGVSDLSDENANPGKRTLLVQQGVSREEIVKSGAFDLAPDLQITYALSRQPDAGQGGTLLVRRSSGSVLLERGAVNGLGVLDVVGLRDAGAPFSILVIEVSGGGSMGSFYEAYLYDPGAQQLRRLNWGEQTFGVSLWGVEQRGKAMETVGRQRKPEGGWAQVPTRWSYSDGALRAGGVAE